jgi:hypothetical protein
MRFSHCILFAFVLLFSCSKELSQETANPNPPLGNDCRVNQVTEIDSASGSGVFSYFTQYNQAGQAVGVRAFDSLSNTVQYETSITYRGDTVFVGPSEYFLLDASGRVAYFVSKDNASGFTDSLTIRYTYSSAGYLLSRDLFLDNATSPEYRYTYSWQNGNLTGVEGFVLNPAGNIRIFSATMQYDPGVNIRGNLLPIPDAFEVNLFLAALNLGRVPQNLLIRTEVTLYDPVGLTSETFVNINRSHVISSDGYIQEYTSFTEATAVDPAYSFRVRLGYFCR